MTDIKSEIHNTPKINQCDFTSSPNTGSSIIHIPNTNNIVNNKQVSQQRIYSHTTTAEKMNSNQSKSTDNPLTNFPNGDHPPIILSDGESFGSKNHKHLNDTPDTHPPTQLN